MFLQASSPSFFTVFNLSNLLSQQRADKGIGNKVKAAL